MVMHTDTIDPRTEALPQDTAEAIIASLRAAILGGIPWFQALLGAVARWRMPVEDVDGRRYMYLIGGEAFDWLLLAERLADEIADLVPAADLQALLFQGRSPDAVDADDFRRLIGPAKHSAHLNYLYGVVVEEALLLSVENEVHKELRCRVWEHGRRAEEIAFERLYGHPRAELLGQFRAEYGVPHVPYTSYGEGREFTYWLFKQRMKSADPAKLASDTRRGLAQISELEALRRHTPEPAAPERDGAVIDL